MKEGDPTKPSFSFADAARFWEKQRVWYNAVLCSVVVLWVVFTWPHFRPALNWVALGKMLVLAVLANLCYCAGYVAELFMQPLFSQAYLRRMRWVAWTIGMLIAVVLENYWIADEIYPDVRPESAAVAAGVGRIANTSVASNMNFPAPLAVVGFLVACIGLFVAVAAVLIFLFARKPKFARGTAIGLGFGVVIYSGLLFGFSAGSSSKTLARGQEKYFCEIDCHLAYSIVDVKTQSDGEWNLYSITLRTRFDETTTSPNRPKDAALTPSARDVRIIDADGREYAATAITGTPLITPLKPAGSYATELEFRVPRNASGLRVLLSTAPGWPDHVVIGDENSWLHEKTYFAL
jgi:uncharacterized membrane protein YedE/YeeE